MARILPTASWVTTIAAAALFAVPGAALLMKSPHFAEEMARLGYPAYFLLLLGAFKVAGALVILAPRLPVVKEWAYAGMAFDVIGAVASRLSVGDPPTAIILPVAIGALLAASWALRPPSRKLLRTSNPLAA